MVLQTADGLEFSSKNKVKQSRTPNCIAMNSILNKVKQLEGIKKRNQKKCTNHSKILYTPRTEKKSG